MYCPNLRSVTFLNPTSRLYQLGSILYAALKNVSSERVERIAVELHLGSRDELRITPSDLVTLHYPHLQEVKIGQCDENTPLMHLTSSMNCLIVRALRISASSIWMYTLRSRSFRGHTRRR
jgi:hypothetical protein